MTIRKTSTKRGTPDKKKVNNNNNNGYYDHVYYDQDLLTCANDDVIDKAFSNSWSGIYSRVSKFFFVIAYLFFFYKFSFIILLLFGRVPIWAKRALSWLRYRLSG